MKTRTKTPPPTRYPDGSGCFPTVQINPQVLIAIAERACRERVARVIADLGCEVDAMGDGYRLTERLADSILGDTHRARPCLIIVNPILPGCTGISLLAGLRDLGWDTAIVFVIAAQDVGRQLRWSHGASGVFVDPFDEDELRAFAEVVLDPVAKRTMRAPDRREHDLGSFDVSSSSFDDDATTFINGWRRGR